MTDANALRKGVTFELDGNLYKVIDSISISIGNKEIVTVPVDRLHFKNHIFTNNRSTVIALFLKKVTWFPFLFLHKKAENLHPLECSLPRGYSSS